MVKGLLVRVRTGPSSYLRLTEEQAATYRATVGEYGAPKMQIGEVANPAVVELPEVDQRAEYEAMTVAQLRVCAESDGIDHQGLRKAELIDALMAQQVDLEPHDGAPQE